MYTFDAIDEYGSTFDLFLQDETVSLAETEALASECRTMLLKLSGHGLIGPIEWEGLGKIRDMFVELIESKLGRDHNLSKALNFDSLNNTERSQLSRNMSLIWESGPSLFSEVAHNAISIIEDIIIGVGPAV